MTDYAYKFNRQPATPIRDYILMFIVMVVSSVLFLWLFFRAVDSRLDRQTKMLCESSKVSGNTEAEKVYCPK